MTIKTDIANYESIIEKAHNTPVNTIVNNFSLLTEQLRQYFSRICSDNNTHSEETAYTFDADAPYSFALPESLTHGWNAMYEMEGEGKIYFFEKCGQQWEDFDYLEMDELMVILYNIEKINYSYM